MNLGVFLAIGESIDDFKAKGQDELLMKNNFRTYSNNFKKVYIFSYKNEKYIFYNNVFVLPNKFSLHRYIYSIFLPLFYPREIINCSVFRGLQITGGIPAIIVKIFFRKKVIINFGYDYSKVAFLEGKILQGLLYKITEKILLTFPDKIIVTSKVIQSKLNIKKSRFIPNGVNTDIFKPMKNIRKQYTALFVGRLERQKNLYLLIDALSQLPLKKRSLLIIGDGSVKYELIKYSKNKKILYKIISRIPHSLLPKYYNCAKMFILPSFLEGNPKSLLEAMSCGLPVLGNNVEGINNILNNRNGLLFDNEISLNNKIKILLDSPSFCNQLGSRARKFIRDNYDYNTLEKREIKLLKGV